MWQGEILILYGLKKNVFKEQTLFIRVQLHLTLGCSKSNVNLHNKNN